MGGQQGGIDPRLEFKGREQPSTRRPDLGIVFMDHMQDHAIICRVELVSMGIPFAAARMHFHGTRPKLSVDADPGVLQIGTTVPLNAARVHHFHGASVGGPQRVRLKEAFGPNELKEVLSIGETRIMKGLLWT